MRIEIYILFCVMTTFAALHIISFHIMSTLRLRKQFDWRKFIIEYWKTERQTEMNRNVIEQIVKEINDIYVELKKREKEK